VTTWADAAAALFFGTECVACGRPGRPWCRDCAADLQSAVDPVLLPGSPPVIACTRYGGCVPDAVVGFKDRNVGALGQQLAQVLAAGLIEAAEQGVPAGIVVPAPSTPAAVRRRGFDHMWLLARAAAASTGMGCERLLRGGRRADQAGLAFAARRRNVHGSIRVRTPGAGNVIVVDDVRTSGATLAECERALSTSGYTVLAQVVIAATI
jgi:predicted amidophosphoribosyltransferase